MFPIFKTVQANTRNVSTSGDAEAIHRNTLKLPVWHREDDRPLADSYIDAFRKVADNYRNLLG